MTIKKIAFLTAIALGAIGINSNFFPVQAATIGQLSAASNNTVIDSDQGLVWLKLTQSIGKSVQDIASNPNPGFRLATSAEVTQLFNGLVASNAAKFAKLFGKTFDIGIFSTSLGLYANNTKAYLAGSYSSVLPIPFLNGILEPGNFSVSSTTSLPFAGVYQVQTQPVPEPLTIIGSGIALGFGANLKRKFANNNKKKS
jgi:hypothetical protein